MAFSQFFLFAPLPPEPASQTELPKFSAEFIQRVGICSGGEEESTRHTNVWTFPRSLESGGTHAPLHICTKLMMGALGYLVLNANLGLFVLLRHLNCATEVSPLCTLEFSLTPKGELPEEGKSKFSGREIRGQEKNGRIEVEFMRRIWEGRRTGLFCLFLLLFAAGYSAEGS